MSPFLLLQLVGPAIALHVTETLHAAFPDRFVVSPKLRELVGSGKTAIYRPDLTLDPEVVAALAGGDRPSTEDQVRQRALEGLAEEIRLMLGEGVVAAPEDIDLCMIMGADGPSTSAGSPPTWTAVASPRRSTAPASARLTRPHPFTPSDVGSALHIRRVFSALEF
jgi:hypothetical protein